jgi:hypothetical protein
MLQTGRLKGDGDGDICTLARGDWDPAKAANPPVWDYTSIDQMTRARANGQRTGVLGVVLPMVVAVFVFENPGDVMKSAFTKKKKKSQLREMMTKKDQTHRLRRRRHRTRRRGCNRPKNARTKGKVEGSGLRGWMEELRNVL